MADLKKALAWLESKVNLEAGGPTPPLKLERMERICALLGQPQLDYRVVHVTGTNGKGSVSALVSRLLTSLGLKVGTYTSPDLESINERIACDGEPISDEEFADTLDEIAQLESELDFAPTRFEILTAAALSAFSAWAVDVAVIEVGLGGRFDATNVVNADVAVVTNVELDHTELLGDTRAAIAYEKAGIVKPTSRAITGLQDPDLVKAIENQNPSAIFQLERDFGCRRAILALGGWLCDLHTPRATYQDLFVSLHGRHQVANAAISLMAVEALLDTAVPSEAVEAAFGRARVPGRLEPMGRQPLVLLDGAHNPAGAVALASALTEEFASAGRRVYLLGMTKPRSPDDFLAALDPAPGSYVLACPVPSPRSIHPDEIAQAAKRRGLLSATAPDASRALSEARALAGEDGMVVVTGSLYLVGSVRSQLRSSGPSPVQGRLDRPQPH